MNESYDLVIIGAGPAGIAAAKEASAQNVDSILLVDRDTDLGGILNQCIHMGFGLKEYGQELTGPEYAHRAQADLLDQAQKGLDISLNTFAVGIEKMSAGYEVGLSSPDFGFCKIQARSIILAQGCKERTAGQLKIAGSRPAGIYTAGSVQQMINIANMRPGSQAIILGLGDIGLIAARRLMLEGMDVKLIVGQFAGGLLRNYINCVQNFGIEVKLAYTVVKLYGNGRLEGVDIAPISADGVIDYTKTQYIACDTLIVAAGLMPEVELFADMGDIAQDAQLNDHHGIGIDIHMQTSMPGVFAAGNVVRVYDTADEVSRAGAQAGYQAAKWLDESYPTLTVGAPLGGGGRKLTEEDLEGLNSSILCTRCPRGCSLIVKRSQGKIVSVSGNRCERGREFALNYEDEKKDIICTTVKIQGAQIGLLPVKSQKALTQQEAYEFIGACSDICLKAPYSCGDRISLSDSPCDALATRTLLSVEG